VAKGNSTVLAFAATHAGITVDKFSTHIVSLRFYLYFQD